MVFLGADVNGMEMQRQKRVTDFFSSSFTTKETPTNTRTPFFELETKPIVKKKLRLSIDENDLKQTILDFGQTCGGQYCKQCDMMYSVVSAAEVKLHEEHHNRFANISEVQISLYCLNLWLRKECHYLSKHGYIFRIRPDSKSSLRRRVEKVIELISDGDPIIGVNRLWTHPTARMKGIAREILDVARKWCFTGILVPKHRIAFSEPSDDGKRFAERYVKYVRICLVVIYIDKLLLMNLV
uniref:N-acetyltransferase ESCO1 n=1 Tax=Angiostrongylus cantonensis TaxID=6313 RepID=A0A0K0D963_ANGCA